MSIPTPQQALTINDINTLSSTELLNTDTAYTVVHLSDGSYRKIDLTAMLSFFEAQQQNIILSHRTDTVEMIKLGYVLANGGSYSLSDFSNTQWALNSEYIIPDPNNVLNFNTINLTGCFYGSTGTPNTVKGQTIPFPNLTINNGGQHQHNMQFNWSNNQTKFTDRWERLIYGSGFYTDPAGIHNHTIAYNAGNGYGTNLALQPKHLSLQPYIWLGKYRGNASRTQTVAVINNGGKMIDTLELVVDNGRLLGFNGQIMVANLPPVKKIPQDKAYYFVGGKWVVR